MSKSVVYLLLLPQRFNKWRIADSEPTQNAGPELVNKLTISDQEPILGYGSTVQGG